MPRLNRHAALDVLSAEFITGLELPADLRLFGDSSDLEFEPLVVALRRELKPVAANTVRLVLAGDADRWELDEWPATRWLARWSADGVSVEIGVPRSILENLTPVSRNRLAGWVEAGLARVLEVDGRAVVAGAGTVIAEVAGAGKRVRFGVAEPAALVPGPDWGIGSGDAHVIRAASEDERPDLRGRPLQPRDLRVLPPGTVSLIELGPEIRGSVSRFGSTFWAAVGSACRDVRERIQGQAPIAEVQYSDRYISSPLAMRALLEVVRSLTDAAGKGAEGAKLKVVTADVSEDRQGAFIHHNWMDSESRRRTFESAAGGIGLRGSIETKSRRESAHARQLVVRWADGKSWSIHLDEGFGFLETSRAERFDFRASPEQQAKELIERSYSIEPRRITYLYASTVK